MDKYAEIQAKALDPRMAPNLLTNKTTAKNNQIRSTQDHHSNRITLKVRVKATSSQPIQVTIIIKCITRKTYNYLKIKEILPILKD